MTARPSLEWDVPAPVPVAADLDERLRGLSGRTDWLRVVADHEMPAAGRCPGCGWPVVGRRDCPSREIARCLLDGRALPSRLVHLADVIPGARVTRDTAAERDARREAEDAAPGLFAAPARVPEPRSAR